jgi:hypothetical protein
MVRVADNVQAEALNSELRGRIQQALTKRMRSTNSHETITKETFIFRLSCDLVDRSNAAYRGTINLPGALTMEPAGQVRHPNG